MTLSTYLTFDGQCGPAFDFYKSVFGGDFAVRSTFADGPEDMKVRDADKGRIMHVSLPIGDSVLMGSDTTSDHGGPITKGNNFSVSYSPKTKDEAETVFRKLSEGGSVTMDLQNTFWGAYFGMCTDKFGIQWMVNVDTQGN